MKIFLEEIDLNLNPGAYHKFYFFFKKSIEENNDVSLTDNVENSDIVFSYILNKKNNLVKCNADQLVILDWSDGGPIDDKKCIAYFRKSWANCNLLNNVYVKKNRVRKGNLYPLQEIALPCYFDFDNSNKSIDLVCLLRDNGEGDFPNRFNVLNILKKCAFPNAIIGAIDSKFGKELWKQGFPAQHSEYLKILSSAKIIVTCGPSKWEGDSRLWEGLASGGCVLTDKIYADMGHNPIHGQECFYYDVSNLDTLIDLISILSKDDNLCKKVGEAGKELCYKFHTANARFQQILDIIWKKKCLL